MEPTKKKTKKKIVKEDTAEDREAMTEIAKHVVVIGPIEGKDLFPGKIIEAAKKPLTPKKVFGPYILTLFKLEGHAQYRGVLTPDMDNFTYQVEKVVKAKITEKVQYTIDRVTGDIKKI